MIPADRDARGATGQWQRVHRRIDAPGQHAKAR